MAPHVSAVIVHEDGNVTHNLDAAFRAMESQRLPLLKESELEGALHLQFALILQPKSVKTFWVAPGYLSRPEVPGSAGMNIASHFKQHKVFQPPCISTLEIFKTAA